MPQPSKATPYPVTPDGHYFVVKERLWRCTNPSLPEAERTALVARLMDARRAVGRALRAKNADTLNAARAQVDEVKVGLGERGPVWWSDGASDFNRHLVKNSPYAEWWREVSSRA